MIGPHTSANHVNFLVRATTFFLRILRRARKNSCPRALQNVFAKHVFSRQFTDALGRDHFSRRGTEARAKLEKPRKTRLDKNACAFANSADRARDGANAKHFFLRIFCVRTHFSGMRGPGTSCQFKGRRTVARSKRAWATTSEIPVNSRSRGKRNALRARRSRGVREHLLACAIAPVRNHFCAFRPLLCGPR